MKQIEQQNKRVSPSPQKGAITERGLFRLMLPSLLGILLCSTCLAGLTWACFSDSVTSSANTITAATFTVEVTITEITGGSSPTTTAEAGSTGTSTNGNLASGAGGQKKNPPSGTSSVTAPNTAANTEGNTLMVNEPSVETKDPSTENPTIVEGGTDTRTSTQPGVTITGKDSTSAADTSGAGPVSQIEAAGKGGTTGKDSTSEEGTSEGGSVSQDEAAGEVTFAAPNSSKTGSETDTTVNRNEDGSYSLTLTEGNKYTVKLKAIGTTKGYCKVTVNGNDYYTEKMDPAQELQELVFSIDCSSMTSETTVRITPGWVNSDYPNIEGEAATNKIDSGSTIVTPTTGANTTTTEQSASAAAAKTDETLREEIVQSNEQTNNGETAGGTTENTTADTARTVPGESSKTTGESTDGDEEPANEGTDTEKANSEPSADEPTDPPSEGQSE